MLKVEYTGWSTFRLSWRGGPSVVVDPCFSPLLDDPHAAPEDCEADVVLLTHGHHEHIRDTHRVARFHGGPFVAPPQVIDFLVHRRRLPRRRFLAIEPDESVDLGGLTVRARGFPHLVKHDVAGKLAILRRDNPLGGPRILLRHAHRVALSYLVIRGQPEQGPFLAYDLQWQDGPRVFFSCEAFTELLDVGAAEEWGRGERPVDLAIVGVESGQEAAADKLTTALAARRSLAAAVHAPFERFYGKPVVQPDRWVAGRPEREFWQAGRRESLDLDL